MLSYILDANVIFSSLLSGKHLYRKVFDNFHFYIPDFALSEISIYQQTILSKTKLQQKDLQDFTLFVFSKITVVPDLYLTSASRKLAYELCEDIDPKDTAYIALSIELNIPLITRDKQLFNGLQAKQFTNIVLFDTFIENMGNTNF